MSSECSQLLLMQCLSSKIHGKFPELLDYKQLILRMSGFLGNFAMTS